jgi:hypothetical protein
MPQGMVGELYGNDRRLRQLAYSANSLAYLAYFCLIRVPFREEMAELQVTRAVRELVRRAQLATVS